MEAAVKLTQSAMAKTTLWIGFWIEKFSNKKPIESFRFFDDHAQIIKPPSMAAGDLLMIEISMPSASIDIVRSRRTKTGTHFDYTPM
jgi:hypothetical protein